MKRLWYHRLAPWVLLLAGFALASQGLMAGDRPLLAWLGIALILTAGVQGCPPWLAALALALAPIRFTAFLLPITRYGMGQAWPVALGGWVGFTLWEATPLLLGGLVVLLAARRERIPGWAVFVLTVSIFTAASVWLPRPYHLSLGGGLVEAFPELIWLVGADLAGGLTLGALALAVMALHRPVSRAHALLATAPLAVVAIGVVAFRGYAARAELAPKQDHHVMAVQGGLPPWSGGFAVQSKRALYPMIAFSNLRPDLLLFPENLIQTAPGDDPEDAKATEQRHFTAIGMGIAVPYSQIVFGVRDFETSRLYFSDLIDGRPQVAWKDLWGRIPFVDVWPKVLSGTMEKAGRISSKMLRRPERTPAMNIFAKDLTQDRGLRPIGRALLLQSGEVRQPRLIQRIRRDADIVVAVNPTIGGWCGPSESRAATVQANARLLELGLIGYRVGQLSGTEFFVPWRETRDEVKALGNGSLTFTARVPSTRAATGFTTFGWVLAFYACPLGALGAFLWLWRAERQGGFAAA